MPVNQTKPYLDLDRKIENQNPAGHKSKAKPDNHMKEVKRVSVTPTKDVMSTCDAVFKQIEEGLCTMKLLMMMMVMMMTVTVTVTMTILMNERKGRQATGRLIARLLEAKPRGRDR